MFINKVPDHDLCELKPNSGALHGTRLAGEKIFQASRRNHAQNNRNRGPRGEIRLSMWRSPVRLWQRCVPFIVKQVCQELAHIAWRIEMARHTPGAAADREGDAVEVGHD